MATVNIKAENREGTGKGAARRVRRGGVVPAVVYRAGEAAAPISIDPKELELQFRRTNNPNTLVVLNVGGRDRTCLVRDVQRHPVSGDIRHVDFYEVTPDQKVVVTVPIEPVGRAEGTRKGGKLRVIQRLLDVRCRPGDIPANVPIDVTALDVGQFIRASQVQPPANTELVFDADFNVLSVLGKREKEGGPPAGKPEEKGKKGKG